MGWEKDLFEIMKEQGFNTDVKLLEGVITKTAPLTFQPYGSKFEMNARFSASVADGASVDDVVLAIQDMTTRSCYVIARLI